LYTDGNVLLYAAKRIKRNLLALREHESWSHLTTRVRRRLIRC